MFTNILVALDGSPMAEAALAPAAFIAKRMKSAVKLVHVIEKNAPEKVHDQPHLTTSQEAENYLKKVSETAFDPSVFIERHVHTAEVENVARSIVEHAQEFSNDLIIICTHGSGSAKSWLLGSIGQQIIAQGNVPVLIVHPQTQENSANFSCDKILLPFDGKPQHKSGLVYAKDFALFFNATIDMVTAIPTLDSISGPWTKVSRLLPGTTAHLLDIEESDAWETLRNQQKLLHTNNTAGKLFVVRGDPAREISKIADSCGANILMVSTHKKIGFSAFWEGSVAASICRMSKIPVLLIPIGQSELGINH